MGESSKTITVEYFAVLREQAGRPEEIVQTHSKTALELYRELSGRYAFPGEKGLKVAVNAEFSTWSRPLCDGDAVVFIPPVAGG